MNNKEEGKNREEEGTRGRRVWRQLKRVMKHAEERRTSNEGRRVCRQQKRGMEQVEERRTNNEGRRGCGKERERTGTKQK